MPIRRVFTEHDHVVRLRDGRALGYSEFGVPDGVPVVSCHGGLTSRLDVAPADAEARRQGVRLISPDRPGIGISDRKAGRTLLDWADDVAELADKLGIDHFAVMGWSLGGDYAAGCAYALGDRIRIAGLVGSGTPENGHDLAGEVSRLDRAFVALAARAPTVDRVAFRAIGESAARLPGLLWRTTGAPKVAAEAVRQAVVEGMRNTNGVVDEYRILGSALPFDPADIVVPVHLWHGDADTIVPPAWAHALARRIPNATLDLVPGADHFLWYERWTEILSTLVDGAQPATAS